LPVGQRLFEGGGIADVQGLNRNLIRRDPGLLSQRFQLLPGSADGNDRASGIQQA